MVDCTVTQMASDIANVIVAIIAMVALAVAAKQLKAQRENTALETYRQYVRLALEHPEFSGPALQLADFNDKKTKERYEWFVSYLLMAAEQILDLDPNNPEWLATITTQLGYHKEYLNSSGKQYLNHYSMRLRELIERI